VFEWNGPMLHAKTAVADCRWARVGSTNLNLASWMGNWELDVAVEDPAFARDVERAFEEDLANATEVVLGSRRRIGSVRPARLVGPHRRREGSAVAAAGAVRIGATVSAALGGQRVLGPTEATLLVVAGAFLLGSAALAIAFPWVVLGPFVAALVWLGAALLLESVRVRRESARARAEEPVPAREGRAASPPPGDGAPPAA
jgi:cardiolipin synthase